MGLAGLWMGSLSLSIGFFFIFLFFNSIYRGGHETASVNGFINRDNYSEAVAQFASENIFCPPPITFCVVVWSVKRFWYTNVLL